MLINLSSAKLAKILVSDSTLRHIIAAVRKRIAVHGEKKGERRKVRDEGLEANADRRRSFPRAGIPSRDSRD